MQQDAAKSFMQSAGRYPLITASEEIVLGWAVWNWLSHPAPCPADIEAAGRRAREKLIASNLRLVVSVAKKYYSMLHGTSMGFEDLLQEGTLGLARAAEKFDPSQGYKFSTYAYWWIRQGVTRSLSQQGGTIRVPAHIAEKIKKLGGWSRSFSEEHGRSPSRREFIEGGLAVVGLTLEQYEHIQSLRSVASLDRRLGEGEDTSLGDLIPGEDGGLDAIDQDFNRMALESLFERASITPREREILSLSIAGGMSYRDIGQRLGISRERTRQIKMTALRRLQAKARRGEAIAY